MPLIKAAKKAIRSDAKKAVFNARRRKVMKSAEKTVRDFVSHKKGKEALTSLSGAYQAIDKAVKAGLIKKNTAARKKSRLAKAIKKLG